jgi:hypothetical protein
MDLAVAEFGQILKDKGQIYISNFESPETAASHAERKMFILNQDENIFAISHSYGPCPECAEFFKKLSLFKPEKPYIIIDPDKVYVFSKGEMHVDTHAGAGL